MPAPTNIDELTKQLADAFEQVKNDPRRVNQAKEMGNIAGKMIAAARLQLEYAYMKGEDPEIPFIGRTSGKPMRPGAKLLG